MHNRGRSAHGENIRSLDAPTVLQFFRSGMHATVATVGHLQFVRQWGQSWSPTLNDNLASESGFLSCVVLAQALFSASVIIAPQQEVNVLPYGGHYERRAVLTS